jgi:hypothetical protein
MGSSGVVREVRDDSVDSGGWATEGESHNGAVWDLIPWSLHEQIQLIAVNGYGRVLIQSIYGL